MQDSTIIMFQTPPAPDKGLDVLSEAIGALNAHLIIQHLGVLIPVSTNFAAGTPYAAIAVPDEWLAYREETNQQLVASQAASRTYLQERGISGEVQVLSAEQRTLAHLCSQRARLCDLSILGDSLRQLSSLFDTMAYNLMFHSGGPIMINAQENHKALRPEHVMIAWDASLPAATAVRLALPILKAAGTVSIATIDARADRHADGQDPGADVSKWLSHHGCNVVLHQFASGGQDIGQTILRRATEAGTDLLVMGGYGHTRLREAMFGGTTRTMIEQTDLPVFLAH